MSSKAAIKEFRSGLSDIKTLVSMQLKESLSFSFKADPKGSLTKLLLYVLGVGAITGIISGIIMLLNALGVLGGGVLPMPMWNVFFFTLLILNLIACVNKVTDALYFSADNQILLCLPVQSNHVYISKIIVFFFNELIRNCFSLLPLLLSLGIVNGLPWYFYPWSIVALAILSLLPVAIASIVSVPAIYVKAFLKRFPAVESLLILGLLIAATVLLFKWAGLIPEDLDIAGRWGTEYFPAIVAFCRSFQMALYPLLFLTHLAVGYTGSNAENPRLLTVFTPGTGYVVLAIFLIIAVLLVASFFIARPMYFRLASKSFEFAKPSFRKRFRRGKRYLSNLAPFRIDADGNFSDEERARFLETILNKAVRKHLSCEDKAALVKQLNELAKGKAVFRLGKGPVDDVSGACLVFVKEERTERLAVMRPTRHGARFYCPHHVWRKNIGKPSFFSFLLKEIMVNVRSSQTVAGTYALFIVGPIATLILNAIFNALRTSFQGNLYSMLFNALIIMLIFLANNVSMASVYSREGRAGYQLRSSPVNYLATLASKLFLHAAVMTGSLAFTVAVYANNNHTSYMNFTVLFFCFYAIYLGHLLWAAEMDFMNPQIELYAETGGQGVINANEGKASALAFILSFAFALLVFVFIRESVITGFYHLLAACLAFLLMRIVLFLQKIRAYSTSTYEGRNR